MGAHTISTHEPYFEDTPASGLIQAVSGPALDGESSSSVSAYAEPDRRALAAALAMHAAVLALLAIATGSAERLARPPEPAAIAVELISPSSPAVSPETVPQLVAPPADSDEPPAEAVPQPTAADPDAMIEATDLRAASILSAPENRYLAEGFRQYADSERVVQLCNLEALEQIRAERPDSDPDTLVAYAMDDMDVDGLVLDAPGGAWRGHDQWYEIALHCEVTPDLAGVESFAFRLGEAIPEELWEEHYLTTVAGEMDYSTP